jgi:hypothetical protein
MGRDMMGGVMMGHGMMGGGAMGTPDYVAHYVRSHGQ